MRLIEKERIEAFRERQRKRVRVGIEEAEGSEESGGNEGAK